MVAPLDQSSTHQARIDFDYPEASIMLRKAPHPKVSKEIAPHNGAVRSKAARKSK